MPRDPEGRLQVEQPSIDVYPAEDPLPLQSEAVFAQLKRPEKEPSMTSEVQVKIRPRTVESLEVPPSL